MKLRAAMADPTLQDELEDLDEVLCCDCGWATSIGPLDWHSLTNKHPQQSDEDDPEEAAAKREALRRAAGGDWSAAVDAQTKATTGAVDSPFEKQSGSGAVLASGEEALELTPANVDKVLDEVRPYLISDGGNIEVVRVETDSRNVSRLCSIDLCMHTIRDMYSTHAGSNHPSHDTLRTHRSSSACRAPAGPAPPPP